MSKICRQVEKFKPCRPPVRIVPDFGKANAGGGDGEGCEKSYPAVDLDAFLELFSQQTLWTDQQYHDDNQKRQGVFKRH